MKALAAFLVLGSILHADPLALLPENPHYFTYRGKPTVLITSGEHYGAVLNPDFDYVKYLDTLAADGLNLTRTFSGAYCEPQGAFNIAENTMAPKSGRLLCPWARSEQPGYANGGNKFDLTKWDDAYFKRLRDFVAQAGQRGVIVEFNLFCPMYEDMQWALSPMNAANNINNLGKVGKHDVYDLAKNGDLQPLQEALVRKFAAELRDAENVYYEICNEPYFGGVTLAWQYRIADVIADAEKDFPSKHLISQNVANGSAKIEKPHPVISIFNFHYASPPSAVAENFALNKVIGMNETGFKGTGDDYYRGEAWEFVIAGGALYNNLDYSFTAGHEDGKFAYPQSQPGGGTTAFRKQMKVLKEFVESFDFAKMSPAREIVKSGLGDKTRFQVLAQRRKQYAIYIKGEVRGPLGLEMPAGKYQIEQIDVLTGEAKVIGKIDHAGGDLSFDLPRDRTEFALRIVRAS